MALWKQPREQPFTTYRDPETGRWITVKPAQPIQDALVEAPLYREPEIGQWITIKPTNVPENSPVANSCNFTAIEVVLIAESSLS